jgi:hypothetical protein
LVTLFWIAKSPLSGVPTAITPCTDGCPPGLAAAPGDETTSAKTAAAAVRNAVVTIRILTAPQSKSDSAVSVWAEIFVIDAPYMMFMLT